MKKTCKDGRRRDLTYTRKYKNSFLNLKRLKERVIKISPNSKLSTKNIRRKLEKLIYTLVHWPLKLGSMKSNERPKEMDLEG